MTFMDDYNAGLTDGTDIDSHIDRYVQGLFEGDTEGLLCDYLGMTQPQYQTWYLTGKLPERGAP